MGAGKAVVRWVPYIEPNGKASRYAIASACGRWTVARYGAWPNERYGVWERTADGWRVRGFWPSAEEAKAHAETDRTA